MTRFVHRSINTLYLLIIIATFGILEYIGYFYYRLPEGLRPFDKLYELLKPSGLVGHGLGIIGSFIMLFGLFSYMARKRVKIFSRWGILKYWLEFHIFMCTWGSVMILFHTTFKFGGIISIGFWSLAIVWTSGFIGRFIYIQIPHSIEGRELSLREVQEEKENLDSELLTKYNINISTVTSHTAGSLKLLSKNLSTKEFNTLKRLIKTEQKLTKRIKRLDNMKQVFNYWHFAHLPFAIIMIIILIIHVGIQLFFGYKWIL
jgi:hypothetical protein